MTKIILAAAIAAVAATHSASAVTVTIAPANAGSTLLEFEGIPGVPTAGGPFVEDGVSIQVTPNALVVNSDTSSVNLRPIGSTGNYLKTGETGAGGSITLTFTTTQTYLGLLWGTVDATNLITFSGGVGGPVAYTGAQLATLGLFSPANGTQTRYVNFSDLEFTSVNFSSTQVTFELDNVAINAVATPDGGMTAALLGLSMSGIAFVRRKLAA